MLLIWVGVSRNNISSNNIFNNNSATFGGAINIGGNNCTIFNNTIFNNTATQGGGIALIVGAFTSHSSHVFNNTFYNNNTTQGGGIFINTYNISVSGNIMYGNVSDLDQMIYNNGNMGILNLIFLNNGIIVVRNGDIITIFPVSTDDIDNTATMQNIAFYLNGVLYENITVIEGLANFTFTIDGVPGGRISVSGSYKGIGDFDLIVSEGLLKFRK
ncbi:hypothetical protein ALNOE001_16310 [Candidatus Methanobinarius endosymbioticus]|uniref:Right handed beta helix domain-containing protein n=1 Tax=Candidatus Methanobinarius endosymbioticus TaxID=2006182 RepID=A0A366MAQ0_9EURY|nr:hypothetical protein ALNOE001_16310 [Candidatus Methanobinarius endosymbioticus]